MLSQLFTLKRFQRYEDQLTLLQGDYVSAHTFSWTEFDIDAETQKLTITTYGIDAYSEADLLADPQAVLDLSRREYVLTRNHCPFPLAIANSDFLLNLSSG